MIFSIGRRNITFNLKIIIYMADMEPREITKELGESYLDYAMSVIVARALPDVRDGMKPVHRRVLWAMWDMGVLSTAKFRKSAYVVGETMAKYHPHGDSSIYDTMVRMAQDFSLRYPLVKGQGNFGSVDGDPRPPCVTRRQNSRDRERDDTDIEKETVDWIPNYDGTRNEPTVFPARLPNLLLNGALGIAVGMATSIPPHNLNEIADAILYLADNEDATSEDLLQFVKGPDFPTGGIIYDIKAIKEAYVTGRGGIMARAKAEIVEKKNSRQFDIVVTEIPYQVNKSELIKTIAEFAQDKKIEGIRDLRDESDREGMRIVIELKNDVAPQKVLNWLFKHTDLEKNFNYNMIALVNGIEPQLLTLRDILVEYIKHRKEIVTRRTKFDLRKAEARAHILEGLMIALDAITV